MTGGGAAGEEVGRVEREHEGALIVGHAAADQHAVLARDGERREVPALTGGHDVGVGDRGDVALGAGGAGDVGKTKIAVEVRDLEAQALRHALRLDERVVCGRAPGLAGLGVLEVLHGVVAHEAIHVCDDVLPDLVHESVYLALELLVNHVSSSASRFFSPTILARERDSYPAVFRRLRGLGSRNETASARWERNRR